MPGAARPLAAGSRPLGRRAAGLRRRAAQRGPCSSTLDQEERDILPLAEEHVSVAEWAKLGEHGRGSMSRDQLPIMFGAILEDADPTERAEMLAQVPAPIRLVLRTRGARQYRRYISRVREG